MGMFDFLSPLTTGVLGGVGDLLGAGQGEEYTQDALNKALGLYDDLDLNVDSAYGSEDPALRNYQLSAIEDLRNLYEQGGLDDRAKARLEDIRRSEDVQAKGAREAILQDARSRGIGGGDLVSQMLNAQGSADRRSASDTQVSADSEQRAIEALLNSANLSTTTRGQDYAKMSALDRIAQFNADNRYNLANSKSNLYQGIGTSQANQYNSRMGAGLNVAGTIAGAYAGGPAGAQAGSQVGSNVYGESSAPSGYGNTGYNPNMGGSYNY